MSRNGGADGGDATDEAWPKPLQAVRGPVPAAKLRGAADGMGTSGPATRGLIAAGWLPPDLLCGMTLMLLARQPREPRPAGAPRSERASPIAGSVWVHEQFTVHRPLAADDPFTITGESTGRQVRKGRRYGTNRSWTRTADGRLAVSNLTTGLLGYRVEAGLADGETGVPLAEVEPPAPDRAAAAANPHAAALRAARAGAGFGGVPVTVALAMMAARDTDNPDNPIHSDPEQARRAGLARPIAGGSHVLAFALEPLLAAFGPQALLHGSHFDVRWKAPTEADAVIVPRAVLRARDAAMLHFDLEVMLAAGGAVAMTGRVSVPLPD